MTRKPGKKTCIFELAEGLCGERAIARGYCKRHYKALERRGAFKRGNEGFGRTLTKSSLARNLTALEVAKRELENAAPRFTEDLISASRVAAEKGDSRPAQFGLLHARAITPVDGRDGSGPGIVVNIGLAIGNVPPRAAESVTASEITVGSVTESTRR